MNQTMSAVTTLATPVVTIGANFAGANYRTDPGEAVTPPDTDGAVGPNAIVELLNNEYQVYDKSGTLLQISRLQDFWLNAGVTFPSLAVDPRVVYDPESQRWFASSGDNPFLPNTILLAVSNTSDPTQGWQAISIPSDPAGQTWADFDMLGVNEGGVFIAVNMYVVDTPNFSSEQVIAIPKADLLQPVPTAVNATVFANVNPGDTGFYPHPALAFQSFGPEPLISASNTFSGSLKVTSIDGPITSPFLDTADRFVSVIPETDALFATQKGTDVLLDLRPGSEFSSSAVFQNDKMFAIQGIEQNGLAALRWFEIGDLLTNPVVLDSGIINPTNLNVYDGSITVNSLGQVLIGFSGSGPNDYPSAYAVAGTLVGDHLQLGDPMLLKAGDGPYLGTEGEAGLPAVRWGDYSATTVDPVNPSHFWTFEDWAADNGSGGIQWSTEISEITFGNAAPPVVTPDRNEVSTPHGTVVVDSAHGVLANDTEPVPGYTLSVSAINGLSDNVGHAVAGEFGTLTLNADGSYSYVDTAKPRELPHKGVGEDVFTYTASDGHGGTSDSTLTIVVTRPHQEYTLGTPGQTLTNGNGPAVLDGALGDQTLVAGKSPVVLIGGPNDTLIAGRSHDTFVFGPTNFGANTIEDFNVHKDTIQIDHTLFANFAAVQLHAGQMGADTVITYDAANTITLQGIALSHLHASDFLFV
jgi:VCBS repeat-containing protein